LAKINKIFEGIVVPISKKSYNLQQKRIELVLKFVYRYALKEVKNYMKDCIKKIAFVFSGLFIITGTFVVLSHLLPRTEL